MTTTDPRALPIPEQTCECGHGPESHRVVGGIRPFRGSCLRCPPTPPARVIHDCEMFKAAP